MKRSSPRSRYHQESPAFPSSTAQPTLHALVSVITTPITTFANDVQKKETPQKQTNLAVCLAFILLGKCRQDAALPEVIFLKGVRDFQMTEILDKRS